MKKRWLGIAICAAALLAAGCSSGTDVSRAADESDTGTAAGKASETTAETAAAKSEAGGTAAEASAVKADPVEKKKFWTAIRRNQRIIWFWNVPGVQSRMRRLIRKATLKAPTI